MRSPILNYEPLGGVPSPPPVEEVTGSGITPLTEGQNYVDVIFPEEQVDTTWMLGSCIVLNTIDTDPLILSTGTMTNKTTSGFRIYFNGAPDSGNYLFLWAILGGAFAIPEEATTYSLDGPSAGEVGIESTNFIVALPASTTLSTAVTITPDDGGTGGTFTPASVTLDTGLPSASFTYTPASPGTKTISTTNDGGLSDPAPISFEVAANLLTDLFCYWTLDEASGARVNKEGTVARDLTNTNEEGNGTGKVGNAHKSTVETSGTPTKAYLSTPDSSAWNITGDVTIAGWIKIDNIGTGVAFLLGKEAQMQLLHNNFSHQWEFTVTNNGSTMVTAATTPPTVFTTGQWYFVCGWYDSTAHTINIQVDNGTVFSAAFTGPIYHSASIVTVHAALATGTYYITTGLQDETGIWKRVLTPTERTTLYNGGAGTTYPF